LRNKKNYYVTLTRNAKKLHCFKLIFSQLLKLIFRFHWRLLIKNGTTFVWER